MPGSPRQRGAAVAATLAIASSLAACGGSKSTTTATSSSSSSSATVATSTGEAAQSRAVSERVVTASSGAVSATMSAAGHHPRVNAPWPISFVVKGKGKPATAEVRYEYLFGGQVVAHRSHYKFTGAFHDTFRWPASAVGYPLTFRAVVESAGATLNLDYPVQVVR